MNIRPVEAELFHADRRTDGRMDRHEGANSRFSQFCERVKKKESRNSSSHTEIRDTLFPLGEKLGFRRLSGTIKRGFQRLKESLKRRGKENGIARSRHVLICMKRYTQ